MSTSQDFINNALKSNIPKMSNNAPIELSDNNTQYGYAATRLFAAERAYLAADHFTAEVQGLTDDFYEYTTTELRLSDVTTNNVTSFDSKHSDDFKMVLLPYYDYIPIGAKIKVMGSTWIVTNPTNLSSPNASAVIARCNAIYRNYDAYGNIITEPVVIQKQSMLDNKTDTPENIVLMQGYFNIMAQRNPNTQDLSENSRLIFGKKAYEIRGFTDFIQEFTDNDESNHILSYAAEVREPTQYDDLVNKIADGLNYTFSGHFEGQNTVGVGQSIQLQPEFLINNAVVTDLPLTWTFATSDSTIATVDDSGNVIGVATGTVTITATLNENPNIIATMEITVSDVPSEYIAITNMHENIIRQFLSVSYTAEYFLNNYPQGEMVTWTLSGASKTTYNSKIVGNTITIECLKPSDTDLTLIASYNGVSTSFNVVLEGY